MPAFIKINTMINQHLVTFLDALKADLINSMQSKGIDSTGQTIKQIMVKATDKNVQLEIPGVLQILEKGRGPTGKNAATGSPPMIERIKQWCQAKGISEKGAWAIKKSIDKKGFKGKTGILTEPLSDENIDRQLKAVLEILANEIAKSI